MFIVAWLFSSVAAAGLFHLVKTINTPSVTYGRMYRGKGLRP